VGFYFLFTYTAINESYTIITLLYSVIINTLFFFLLKKASNIKCKNSMKFKDKNILFFEKILSYSDIVSIFLLFSTILTSAYILKINSCIIIKTIHLELPIIKKQLPSTHSHSPQIKLLDKNEKEYYIKVSLDDIGNLKLGDIYKVTIYKGWLDIDFYKTEFFGYKRVEP
jgi:hypothetical protein